MSGIVYLNGVFVNANDARISPFDRGFLFADSVYEVTSVLGGKLVDFDAHLARLQRSCLALDLELPLEEKALLAIHKDLIARNDIDEGVIYLQLSRGSAPRNFLINKSIDPTLFMFGQSKSIIDHPKASEGIKVVTYPDERWMRCEVKTIQLLTQSLARTYAINAGADDAWFVNDGYVTEGSSNNAFILTHDDVIITRPISDNILPGITRQAILECAAELDLQVETRAFSVEEALEAKEAFITSASTFVWPVIEIDGRQIGDGKPGPVFCSLRAHYIKQAKNRSV